MSVDDIDLEHSERGPSTAHRWRRCPGSVRMSRGLPDDAGWDAAVGTVFHDYAADCLELGLDPQFLVGDEMEVEGFGRIEFDQEMADNMLAGLDILWAYADAPGAKLIVEKRVSLENWVGENEFGTTDAAVIDVFNWRLVVFDWKYGAVPVHPERNDQAMLYCLGVWDDIAKSMFAEAHYSGHGPQGGDFELYAMPDVEVIIMIEQPRAPGGGGTWRTTLGQVMNEGRRIRADAKKTELDDAPLVPGEVQCKYCPAAKHNVCEARVEHLMRIAHIDLDEAETAFIAGAPLELPKPKAISPEARSQILLHRDQITEFMDQLHKEAMKDAEMGRPVPGMKRVEGRRPPRRWRDDAKAEALLVHDFRDEAFTKKLLSPAQVEGKVGKSLYNQRFARQVDEGEAKAILVPDTDPRDPIADVLSDLPDGEDSALV